MITFSLASFLVSGSFIYFMSNKNLSEPGGTSNLILIISFRQYPLVIIILRWIHSTFDLDHNLYSYLSRQYRHPITVCPDINFATILDYREEGRLASEQHLVRAEAVVFLPSLISSFIIILRWYRCSRYWFFVFCAIRHSAFYANKDLIRIWFLFSQPRRGRSFP